jgi:hypothetical protein
MLSSFPTLAVSLIYCLWSVYRLSGRRRHQQLRERVAFMLWVMAHEIEEGGSIICPWQSGPEEAAALLRPRKIIEE